MVDATKSAGKGLLQGFLAFLATALVMLLALPQEQIIYHSSTIGVIVGFLKIAIDVIKHWND